MKDLGSAASDNIPVCKKHLLYKLLFTITVVKDHLVFMTEIPCANDFVQKSLCGKQLPAKCHQRPPDFACTEPFTWSIHVGPQ